MIIFTCINKHMVDAAMVWLNTLNKVQENQTEKFDPVIFHAGDVDEWRFNHFDNLRIVRLHESTTEGGIFRPHETHGMTLRLAALDFFQHRASGVEKVMYYDVDVMFQRPLDELFKAPLNKDIWMLARNDHVYFDVDRYEKHYEVGDSHYFHKRSLAPDGYFNSGAMGIYMEGLYRELKRRGFDRLMDFYNANKARYTFPDQDCLNELVNEYYNLFDRYNAIPELQLHLDFGDALKRREEVQNAHVVHFCGRFKPWQPTDIAKSPLFQMPVDVYYEEVKEVRSLVSHDFFRRVEETAKLYELPNRWDKEIRHPIRDLKRRVQEYVDTSESEMFK